MSALTTRNLFDDLFRRFIPDDARLVFEDDTQEEEGEETHPGEDLPPKSVPAAVEMHRSADEQQDPRLAERLADHGVDGDVIALDLEDDAVVEAAALGANEDDEVVYAREVMKRGVAWTGTEDRPTLHHSSTTAAGEGTISLPVLTAEEQLLQMPIDGPAVFTGVCVLFNHGKGFGFIAPDIGGPDVYYTRESIALTFSRQLDSYIGEITSNGGKDDRAGGALPESRIPELSKERIEQVEEGLRLLQLSKPFLVGGERVSFRVTSNSSNVGGGGQRRKLRAVDITAEARNGPIMLERVLLSLLSAGTVRDVLFAGGAGQATLAPSQNAAEPHDANALESRSCSLMQTMVLPEVRLYATPSGQTPTELIEALTGMRYPGWTKNISVDKGYLRPDTRMLPPHADISSVAGSQDAVLFMDVIVWDPSVDRRDRCLEEGVLIEYSVVGFDRNRKPIAAVVTGRGGAPLHPKTWDMTEVAKQRRAEALASGATDSDKWKRPRDDGGELLLLEDDGDGGYM